MQYETRPFVHPFGLPTSEQPAPAAATTPLIDSLAQHRVIGGENEPPARDFNRLQLLFCLNRWADVLHIRDELKNFNGIRFQATWCFSLDKAMFELANGGYSAVVMRMEPSKGIGIGSLALLRDHAGDTPLMAITTSTDKDLRQQSMQVGAQAVLAMDHLQGLGLGLRYCINSQLHSQPA